MRKDKLLILVSVLLIVPFLTGGVMNLNPATEEEELVLISSTKEKNMGRNINKQVKKHYELPVDPLVQERIKGIGEGLAQVAERSELVYHFTVLNDKKDNNYNAFAAPGGYIYIFDDLVDVLETDDKIAAVLAHEMGHVEAKHSIKRLQGSLGATLLVLLGSQMKTDNKSFAAANAAIGTLMSAYSRHDERQADDLSIKYLKRAGFDPNGAVESLKTIKKLRKKAPLMKYLHYKSHPYLSERIAHIKKEIKGYMDFDSYINIVPEKHKL
ncbi:MAG: M48 family metalloprotease [Candidatus Omnitrophota bacterium]